MNVLIQKYYQVNKEPQKGFEDVIFLVDTEFSFEKCKEICPSLPKGWYELAKLNLQDRIDFTKEYWFKTLPLKPQMYKVFEAFFQSLDDIGVFLVKKKQTEKYTSHFVYSIQTGAAFFYGLPPVEKESDPVCFVPSLNFPKDFLAFFKIHNGFSKNSDLGIIQMQNLKNIYSDLQAKWKGEKIIIKHKENSIDFSLLLPFYERFGLGSFQCFFGDWYPESEMGNVYFSAMDYTISDYKAARQEHNRSFENFLSWLISYLEGRETKDI